MAARQCAPLVSFSFPLHHPTSSFLNAATESYYEDSFADSQRGRSSLVPETNYQFDERSMRGRRLI
jgi:hypothetical protein